MNIVWESIRMGVCRNCIDGDSHGNCRLPSDEFCPLEAYFPLVAETIGLVKSHSPDDYSRILRARVCSQCSYGSQDACRKRDSRECALDRFTPLVVEKIECMKMFVD